MSDISFTQGSGVIKTYMKKISNKPGVYRMLDEKENVLYVGKAKSLKKRISTYINAERLPIRLQRMVSQTKSMVFVTTHTEVEALLLESNLIKKFQPPFNVLLKDDKSFPYIFIPGHHDFPQVRKHRGSKKHKGDYFGPYTYASAVNRTITALQKAFMVRNCSDSYFDARKRPCLQYHIKRCTAPCVGHVSKEDYAAQVNDLKSFLMGESQKIQQKLADKMEAASNNLEFERAAALRDRIKALSHIQARQSINMANIKDADVMAICREADKICIQVFFFRGGQNLGNQAFFPRHSAEDKTEDVFGAFMAQFYQNHPIPSVIFTQVKVTDHTLLQDALTQKADHKVSIKVPQRGEKKQLIDQAHKNAQQALKLKLSETKSQMKLLEGVRDLFDLEDVPERIEIYDNSHISGTNMVGGMVVADREGFKKSGYRKFNIRHADKGDDYGMMREVLRRRFERSLREDMGPGSENWPDLLLIDGGIGQLSASKEVLEDLGILDQLNVVAISKGSDRNAGRETFHQIDKKAFQLPVNDPVLYYLQRLRDEAHRFAIGSHRVRRKKDITKSPLDQIEGVGPGRKKALLRHFGSAKAVSVAGIRDLETVEGISAAIAEKIYNHFHELG